MVSRVGSPTPPAALRSRETTAFLGLVEGLVPTAAPMMGAKLLPSQGMHAYIIQTTSAVAGLRAVVASFHDVAEGSDAPWSV